MNFKEIESKIKYFKDIKKLWEKYKIVYQFRDDDTVQTIDISIRVKFKNGSYGEVKLNSMGVYLRDYDGSTLAQFDFTPDPDDMLLSEINAYDLEMFGGKPLLFRLSDEWDEVYYTYKDGVIRDVNDEVVNDMEERLFQESCVSSESYTYQYLLDMFDLYSKIDSEMGTLGIHYLTINDYAQLETAVKALSKVLK